MCRETLSKVVAKVGSQAALAEAIRARKPGARVAQGHVWKWLNTASSEVPPAEYVLAIAEATAWAFRPHDLRPDLYPNPADALPPSVAADLHAQQS